MVSAPEQSVLPCIAFAAGKGRNAAARQSSLELIAVHTALKQRLRHGRGFQYKPVRVKMHYDARAPANTFQGSGIIIGVTASACKQVGDACTLYDFGAARRRLDVTQSDTLRRRQT